MFRAWKRGWGMKEVLKREGHFPNDFIMYPYFCKKMQYKMLEKV
jgi:hypothetical protein